jgi:HAD superfamily phosphatase (TIGR01668 family)
MSSKPHRKLEVVLFDLGNTLLYFDGIWDQVIVEMDATLLQSLQSSGYQLDEQDFMHQAERRFAEFDAKKSGEFLEFTTALILCSLLSDLGYAEIPEAVLHKAIRDMYTVSQSHWQLEADALPTLKILRTEGYKLGIISNAGDDQDVQALIDKAGIRAYFDIILTSAAQGIRKPNPRLFQQALQHWGTPPERAVMIGDTLGADILGANNAGIYSIWITRRTSPDQPHQDMIFPDITVDTLSALPGLLNALQAI